MGDFTHAYRRMIEVRPSNVTSWTFFVLLWPLSLIYQVAMRLRVSAYRTGTFTVYRARVPVVSVGNLTVGGTGKTPVVDTIVKEFIDRGLRVAVVSRGYGGSCRDSVGCVAMGDGRLLMPAAEAGDEPCLLAARNPSLRVYVARKRVLGVQAAERDGAQIIILDDGFQHLAVARDLDIVLLDSRAPFGNGAVLPAGPLREPRGALARADLVIMTHASRTARDIPFKGPILYCRHRLSDRLTTLDGNPVSWSELEGREVAAFAGIARPDDFFAALRRQGLTLSATLALDDHQDYSSEVLNRLERLCDNNKLLITTEKDAIKLGTTTLPFPCLVAPLVLDFDETSRLDDLLTCLLERVK